MTTEPNDAPRIRAAVIGYGEWGPKVARNAALVAGCRLAAVCDLSRERLDAAGRSHPEAARTRNWRALLDDPRIEAVMIATPADTHFEIALAALRAGKHVLIEKPLARTSEEARALLEESVRRRRVLMVDHTYVFSPAVGALRGLLANGVAGQLRHIESWRLNPGHARADAGVHWDLASHDLSILDYLLADEPVAVAAKRVSGAGRPLHALDLRLAYTGSLAAEIHVSWVAPSKCRRIVIAGSAGTIVYDDLERTGKLRIHGARDQGDAVSVHDTTEPLFNVVGHFVDCIASGRRPQSDGGMGARVVRLLELADESLHRDGAPIAHQAAGACA